MSTQSHLARLLAEHYTNIMWLHDAEDFKGLESEAGQLFEKLGHDSDQAFEAAAHVAQAYQAADRAEGAHLRGDEVLEDEEYDKARRELERVERVLGRDVSVAHHQVAWWRAFRYRRWGSVILQVFLQHRAPLGLGGSVIAIRLTRALARIGVAHNRRDREAANRWGTNYWMVALDSYEAERLPFLG